MVRPLARGVRVWVVGSQREAGTTVLQREPAAGRHDGGTEAGVVAVDEASSVSGGVGDAEVNSVGGTVGRGAGGEVACGDGLRTGEKCGAGG
jgi:hypothetical protein